MHFVSATDGFRGSFRQSEVADFPGAHQARHRAHGFFDGHGWIDAVLIIQVDSFNPESLQAGVTRCAHIFRPAVDTARGGVGFVANDSKLSGEKNFGAQRADGHADPYFVVAVTLDIRAVWKPAAQLHRALNAWHGLLVVPRAA